LASKAKRAESLPDTERRRTVTLLIENPGAGVPLVRMRTVRAGMLAFAALIIATFAGVAVRALSDGAAPIPTQADQAIPSSPPTPKPLEPEVVLQEPEVPTPAVTVEADQPPVDPQAAAASPPIAELEPSPMPPSGLRLQVGAFADPANAAGLSARLGDRFGPVQVTATTRRGKTLHRVWLAGFETEAARREGARALAAEGVESFPVQ